MRIQVSLLVILAAFSGCAPEENQPEARTLLTLDSLAVVVRDGHRSFMLSDKSGGFLVGSIERGQKESVERWTVDGREILNAVIIETGTRRLSDIDLDSCVVLPHRVTRFYANGAKVSMYLLDCPLEGGTGHALGITVNTADTVRIAIRPVPGRGIGTPSSSTLPLRWVLGKNGPVLTLAGRGVTEIAQGGLATAGANAATFYFLLSEQNVPLPRVQSLCEQGDSLLGLHAARMERVLNDSYIRTSDRELNKALYWMKLSLDALVVEARDTFAVAGLPWDGSLDGRDNAQSIAGIGLATGDYAKTAAILRSLARWQDTVRTSSTYGRIPDHVRGKKASYGGADVGAWFVRELYEHVTYANDTALVRLLYPAVKRSILGTEKYHMDGRNLLIHGDNETWMTSARRGNRAAEIQLLWYFEQIIGSFVATFVDDKPLATRWSAGATKTAEVFNELFVDTTRHIVYDHIDPSGQGAPEIRPNPMMCIEIINSEVTRQTILKQIVSRLVGPYGVRTLATDDKRFVRSIGPGGEGKHDGPVWTWLTGQFVYALAGYDRQDFSYKMTQVMVKQALEKDIIGSLPEVFDQSPGSESPSPRAGGLQPSLTAMAELIRSVYQDYLGIHVDASANIISLQPKLPSHITEADFTVMVSNHRVNGQYQRGKETSRLVLEAPDIQAPMKFNFIWMMDSGDAWRGASVLPPHVTVRIVFGPKEILAYQDDRKIMLTGEWRLKHFSRAEEFSSIDSVEAGAR